MSRAARSAWHRRLAVSLVVCLTAAPAARAQYQGAPPQGSQPQGPLSLNDCIAIGLARQPAIEAQRASLAATETQRQALDNMKLAALISKELPIRRQQAALGVSIAQAEVENAEWETVYAVTRCYFTVVYARRQELLARGLVEKLELAKKSAKALVDKGDPDIKLKQTDIDKLQVNIDLLQVRLIEAATGVERATAALREAMGYRFDTPLPLDLQDFPALGEKAEREELIQLALARRPELVQVNAAARVAELEVCAQNTGCLLPFKKTFAAGSDIHAKAIPQGFSNGTYRPGAIGLEMPTTIVGHKADRVERARELSGRAAAVVEKTHNLVALETEDAYHRWQQAGKQALVLRDSAAKAAKLGDLTARDFDLGKVSTEDFLRARTLEDQAQASYNEALFLYTVGLATLERVTAGGFVPTNRRAGPSPR
jgi:outer membrane protein TolC